MEQYMQTQVAPPLTPYAFDDPGTRRHWTRAYRRNLTNVLVRFAIWGALLTTAKVAEDDMVTGPASFFSMVTAFFLIGPSIKLRWLLAVRRILKSGPWQAGTAIRRTDVKRPNGKAVELRIDGRDYGDGERTGDAPSALRKDSAAPGKDAAAVAPGAVLAGARTWRGGIPWTDELSDAAWVIVNAQGRPCLLARPSGSGFMTLV